MGGLTLNGIDIPKCVAEGLRRLSSLQDAYGRYGKPQVWLRDTPAAERLLAPGLDFGWMLDDPTSYFTPDDLIKENALFNAAIGSDSDYLTGPGTQTFGLPSIDPARVVLIGFNLGADNFFALYQTDDRLALIAMCTRHRVWGWALVYDDVTDFLLDARVHAIPDSSRI